MIVLADSDPRFQARVSDQIGRREELVIVDGTTQLDKVLHAKGNPHHVKVLNTPDGRHLVMSYGWSQPLFVMDPAQDNKIIGGTDLSEIGRFLG